MWYMIHRNARILATKRQKQSPVMNSCRAKSNKLKNKYQPKTTASCKIQGKNETPDHRNPTTDERLASTTLPIFAHLLLSGQKKKGKKENQESQ